MNKKKLRFGFIGAGAIGSLFGGYIANIKSKIYSPEVIFFCRKEHAEAINKKGLKILRNQSVYNVKSIKAYENEKFFVSTISENSPFSFDFLFLTTKAYDTETAMFEYKNLIKACRKLIILQNGIGNEEIVKEFCPKSKIIRMLTTNGALLSEPGKVIHTGFGITKIGLPFLNALELKLEYSKQSYSDLKLLYHILNQVSLETTIVDDMVSETWEKVFVNVGINALGALTQLRNGELLDIKGLKYFIGEAVNEAVKVARMKRINLSEKNYVELTYDVAKKTSKNKNSMLQDVLNEKATEIDFINGRIVKYANELGIEVPINNILTCLIKGLEFSFY